MFDLPEHLSSLNALAPSPSSLPVMDQSAEAAVWDYLNTDELFRNFGVQPSEMSHKPESPIDHKSEKRSSPPADLKSFIEQFASENAGFSGDFGGLGLTYPMSMNTPSAPAPTPVGVSTADIMPLNSASAAGTSASPWETSPEDDRPSGAKKLKSIGAATFEIEEDKRRRNTEASARFRAKKKEREQNLERRAKDLESQVAQLSAEKASLENENKLLKAIVLGGNGGQSGANSDLAQLIGKRRRE